MEKANIQIIQIRFLSILPVSGDDQI